MFLLFDIIDSQQKGRSNKKNKKKKRIKTLNKEITLAQAGQQMFGGYYKVPWSLVHVLVNNCYNDFWKLFYKTLSKHAHVALLDNWKIGSWKVYLHKVLRTLMWFHKRICVCYELLAIKTNPFIGVSSRQW